MTSVNIDRVFRTKNSILLTPGRKVKGVVWMEALMFLIDIVAMVYLVYWSVRRDGWLSNNA